MKAESRNHWTAREFPIAFMCISYLLLHSKLLPNLQVLKQQPLFHPVSQSLESESTLVGWFWLKNFHKVVVKMSFGMQVISWLNQTGESFFKLLNMVAGKRQSVSCWLLATGFSSLTCGLDLHTTWQLASSKVKDQK